jgi:glycosyltransferase involved in cell wall biosynthesis
VTARSEVLVVRGDLNSTSGYTRATELYLGAIERQYDIVLGVDLHHHYARATERWEYPLVDDAAISDLIGDDDLVVDILTIATPDQYRPFPARRNIGCFFWETDRLGRPGWITMINSCVSEMWVPARFMGEMLHREGAQVPISWRPCPLPAAAVEPTGDASGVLLLEVTLDDGARAPLAPFGRVREASSLLFLSTNTFIPRKGLPVLVHQWHDVLDRVPDASLVLKVGTIDVTMTRAALERAVTETIRAGWNRATPPRIHLVFGHLPHETLRAMTVASDAQVTTAFGEGFGLGVFETIADGSPALCPRHTALAELLPDDYPYFLDTDWTNVGLADPTNLYPISARWGVAREGALVAAVDRLLADRASGALGREVERAATHARSIGDRSEVTWNT